MYREINAEDRVALQQDNLQEWSNICLLNFHSLKYKLLTVKKKRQKTRNFYMTKVGKKQSIWKP